jgi:hypothetical protein
VAEILNQFPGPVMLVATLPSRASSHACGDDVTVASKPGKGSVFSARLPSGEHKKPP